MAGYRSRFLRDFYDSPSSQGWQEKPREQEQGKEKQMLVSRLREASTVYIAFHVNGMWRTV